VIPDTWRLILCFAIPGIFVHAVARAAFHDRVDLFGGKDETGDGTPEGLPLICRFSPAFGFDTGCALLNQRRD